MPNRLVEDTFDDNVLILDRKCGGCNDVTLIIAREYVYALDLHGKPPER